MVTFRIIAALTPEWQHVGGDLGGVLRLLACPRANSQPDRGRHAEPHPAFLSCRGACPRYVGAARARAGATQRQANCESNPLSMLRKLWHGVLRCSPRIKSGLSESSIVASGSRQSCRG